MDELTRTGTLERLAARWDARRRGKIIQRLLEIAFHHAGYRLVDERLVEGTDFDVVSRARPAERYSFEVRTTNRFTVPVKSEDLRLLDERAADGFATGLAALRIGAGGRWVLIERRWLALPSIRVTVGTTPGWEPLASAINEAFDLVLGRLGPRALEQGLDGLAGEVKEAMR